MLRARVLSVGHGLCVHFTAERYRTDFGPWDRYEGGEQFVYDCGTHRPVTASGVPRAWRALTFSRSRNISTIAISHLHSDHYNGFMYPLPQLSPNVEVVLARMPLLNSDPVVSSQYLMRALAFGSLSPDNGPMEIDLLRQIRRYAPGATPALVSRGEHFVAAGQTWDVLWPPRALNLHERGLAAVKRAIAAYDRATDTDPELKRRLKEVRESELFRQLLEDIESQSGDPLDLSSDDDAFEDEDDEPEEDDFKGAEDPAKQSSAQLFARGEAGQAIRRAANYLSLILASRQDRVLLTGDATKSVTNAAIAGLENSSFGMVTTPHHGGRNHAARDLTLLSARVWATSTGGKLTGVVSSRYDALPGLHIRTSDSRLGFDISIWGHELTLLRHLSGFSYWHPPRELKS